MNGIFAFESEFNINDWFSSAYTSYPCLILFDEHQEYIIANYEYKSDKKLDHEPHQLLYINNKNMVMYEWNGSFYGLHLNEVKEIMIYQILKYYHRINSHLI